MATWIEDANGNKCSVEDGRAIRFALEPFHRNIPREALFQNLANMWGKLGRQPRFRDCRPGISAFSAHTYADRFGSWRMALNEFVAWAENNGCQPKTIEPFERAPVNPLTMALKASLLLGALKDLADAAEEFEAGNGRLLPALDAAREAIATVEAQQ